MDKLSCLLVFVHWRPVLTTKRRVLGLKHEGEWKSHGPHRNIVSRSDSKRFATGCSDDVFAKVNYFPFPTHEQWLLTRFPTISYFVLTSYFARKDH